MCKCGGLASGVRPRPPLSVSPAFGEAQVAKVGRHGSPCPPVLRLTSSHFGHIRMPLSSGEAFTKHEVCVQEVREFCGGEGGDELCAAGERGSPGDTVQPGKEGQALFRSLHPEARARGVQAGTDPSSSRR